MKNKIDAFLDICLSVLFVLTIIIGFFKMKLIFVFFILAIILLIVRLVIIPKFIKDEERV